MKVDRLRAESMMSRCVRTLPESAPLAEGIAIMDREGFSQIPVMRGRKPVGLLTETDLRKACLQGRANLTAGELASPLPRLLRPQSRLSEVLEALQAEDSLLVVTPRGYLKGIITYWDVLTRARPFLLVTEVELLLRRVVAAAYRSAHGPDWWERVPPGLRQQAEEEHQRDVETEPATGEHMLSHTSFWALIEIFRTVRPAEDEPRLQELHAVRRLRNQVAHHDTLTEREELELRERSLRSGDWLDEILGSR